MGEIDRRRFYGWVIVAGLSVAGGFSMALGIGNFGVFVEPMSEDLGIGRAPFGWGLTARLFGFALSGPIIGRIIDRHGARAPLAVAVSVFGLSVASLGLVQAGWQMVGILAFMGLLGFWGSSTLYLTVPVAKWFVRKRGRAMTLVFVGFPVGIALSAPISQALIDAVGWRVSWAIIGFTAGVVIFLISLLIIRNRPEDMGLLPDGEPASLASEAQNAPPEHPWTVHESVRTGAFWRLAVAFGTLMLAMGAVGLFWVPYFISRGFDPQIAAWSYSTYALTQAAGSALLAPLIDRIQPRFLAATGYLAVILCFAVLINADELWQVFVAALLGGTGVGVGMLLQAHMWPTYFGRRNIGAIRGAAVPVTLAFSGAGSSATGMIYDATDSYIPAWSAAIVVLAVGALLLVLTPRPRPARLPSFEAT